MKKKLVVFLCLSCLISIVVAGPALALPASTNQEWSFSTSDTMPLPDVVDNPYGEPLLRVVPMGDWIDIIDGYQGVWPLSGEIDVYIPNYQVTRPEKIIIIDLVWKATDIDPFLPPQPMVGVVPFEDMAMTYLDIPLGGGWIATKYSITLWPNPLEEWITIKGDIMVDSLAIYTECILEPATVCLLGLGALVLLRRRH